jgi:nitrogenase molybdenum-iron protein NifN
MFQLRDMGNPFEGYWLTVRNIVAALAKDTSKHSKLNLIIPHISAADIRELKRILQIMDVEVTLLPDYSDTWIPF